MCIVDVDASAAMSRFEQKWKTSDSNLKWGDYPNALYSNQLKFLDFDVFNWICSTLMRMRLIIPLIISFYFYILSRFSDRKPIWCITPILALDNYIITVSRISKSTCCVQSQQTFIHSNEFSIQESSSFCRSMLMKVISEVRLLMIWFKIE